MNKEYCMYEEHYFNHKINKWQKLDNTRMCINKNCNRKHKLKRGTVLCPLNNNCPDMGVKCFLLHDLTLIKNLCKYGKNCCDLKCEYRHPPNRPTEICPLNEKCSEALFNCFLLHDLTQIVPICKYNKECINFMCDKRHSKERIQPCPEGSMCYNFIINNSLGCPLLHPKILQKLCKWDLKSECKTYGCSFIHKQTSPKDCPNGMQCQLRISDDDSIRCKNKHPKFNKAIRFQDRILFE